MTVATQVQTMRALVLEEIGVLRVRDMERPEPGPGQVRIRVGWCGVCGSDLPRMFRKGAYRHPLVCGHEFAGVVEACGDRVSRFRGGDPVAVFPLLWCGKCGACEQGRYVQCADYDYLGSRSDGGFAEYVCAPEENCLPVPAGVSLAAAAMTEPAAVALHALGTANLAGATVAVWGCGPIGLLAAQWARGLGAGEVVLLDVVPEKLALARTLGFAHTRNTREGDALAYLQDLTGGRGVDLAVDAAGVPAACLQALTATGQQGETVLLGNPAEAVTLSPELLSQWMRREVRVRGTWNSGYSARGSASNWRTALLAMQRGTLQTEALISHRLGLEEAIPALRAMQAGTLSCHKVLIQPS